MSQIFSGMELSQTPSLFRGTLEMEGGSAGAPMPTPCSSCGPFTVPAPQGQLSVPDTHSVLPSLAIPSLFLPDTSWPATHGSQKPGAWIWQKAGKPLPTSPRHRSTQA